MNQPPLHPFGMRTTFPRSLPPPGPPPFPPRFLNQRHDNNNVVHSAPQFVQEAVDSSVSIIRDTITDQVNQFMSERLEQRRLEHERKLNQERQELERERQLFEQEKSGLWQFGMPVLCNDTDDTKGKAPAVTSFPSTIRLNVGGVHHTTLLDTLRSAPETSLLHLLFSGAVPMQTDANGHYFIDRNGKLFQYILDQLRNGFTILPSHEQQRRQVLREAKYYGIELLDESGRVSLVDGNDYELVQDEQLNILNEVQTGGTARVIYIDGQSGATVYNPGTLNGSVTASWRNNGCLVNQTAPSTTTDDPYLSYRTNTATGTVWTNPTPGVSQGVLVIDMGRVYSLSRVNVFSMRSDGQVTQIQISYLEPSGNKVTDDDISKTIAMANTTNNRPICAWRRLVPMTSVSLGTDPSANVVGTPTQFVVRSVRTRFLLVEARNNGQFGNPSYIEIRQLKAYA